MFEETFYRTVTGHLHQAGDVEELPEDAREYNPSIMRIRPTIHEEDDLPSGQQIAESTGRGGQAESSKLLHNCKQ